MKKDEKVRYLANLYCVVTADEAVERIEEKVLEEASRDIGAGYFERREALELAKKEGLQLQPAGRWSERIRNLEDMLLAAYSNNVLESAEKSTIRDYASHLGINQKQMDLIKDETKRRYAEFQG